MKLLIFLALIYFGFRMLKSGLQRTGNIKNNARKKADYGGVAGEIDDVMVQDPFCKVYFPKRDAYRLRYDGTDLYFCSEECKDKFIKSKK
ncbi:MAG: YHS domain-containing protein [Desulfosarcina sp.]|nr:YHS domain-containing protein [Desulfobacterales bacterium]